ncbi:MAG: hypothetical protein N2B57_05375, partial [Planctomycetales bacterium]
MSKHLLLKYLLAIFCFVSLMPAVPSVFGESSTSFGKLGPYKVSMSEVSNQGILLVPQAKDESDEKKQFPGIVFGHGLCGAAKMYSQSL